MTGPNDPSVWQHERYFFSSLLETLSDEENARLWAEEAQRRDEAWEASGSPGHKAADVFREARARLK